MSGLAAPLRSRRAPHEGAIGRTNTIDKDQSSVQDVHLSGARWLPRRADGEHDSHHEGDDRHYLEHVREAQPCHERTRGDWAQRITDVVDRTEHTVGGAVSGTAC